jgi:hypothetical protein
LIKSAKRTNIQEVNMIKMIGKIINPDSSHQTLSCLL